MHYYGDMFYNNTKKSIEILFNDFIKCDNKSSLSKGIYEYYQCYETFLTKIKQSNK